MVVRTSKLAGLYLALLLFSLGTGCGLRTSTPSASASPTASSPTPFPTTSPSPTLSATTPPSTTATPWPSTHVVATFVLTINGKVPAGDSFGLEFRVPDVGQSLFGFCDPVRRPCIGGGMTYTQTFGVLGPQATTYAFRRVPPSGQLEVFKQGSYDAKTSMTFSATYTYP